MIYHLPFCGNIEMRNLALCLIVGYCFISQSEAKINGEKASCQTPEIPKGNHDQTLDMVNLHKDATEVKFHANISKFQQIRPCRIKCVNGEWIGPVCSQGLGNERYKPLYKSCTTGSFPSNLIVSYQNKTQNEDRELDHDSPVQVRCKEFGRYKLIGDSHLKCFNGQWKSRIPTCIPTSSLHNFSGDSAPPTIQYRLTSGSLSIEPSGELAIYPGSTIHLECLFARAQGDPEWSWTSTYRSYPTGWSISPEERDTKYRLSIYYAKLQDTGIFTCSTPRGLTHSVILYVTAAQCDTSRVVSINPHLLIHFQGSSLGHLATFSCSNGFKLIGMQNITCQASGIWSGNPPQCHPVVCPTIELVNTTLRLVSQETKYGGRAVFECPHGHKLIGAAVLFCDQTERWSGAVPECKEILCAHPLVPQNGIMEVINGSTKTPFRVGSIAKFACKGVHELMGESSIQCTDQGFWSNPPPFCRTRCPHPGALENGQFAPEKAVYDVGERIILVCDDGFEATSKSRPRCLKNGLWSESGIFCRETRHKGKILPSFNLTTAISVEFNKSTEYVD